MSATPEVGEHRRRRRVRTVVGAVVAAAVLLVLVVPVFTFNALRTADPNSFTIFQLDSEALVTAKIESTTAQAKAPGIDALGMLYAGPDQMEPNAALDSLARGGTTSTTAYGPYQSQIGFPGYLFTGLYHVGFTTIDSLQTVNVALFVAVLALFTLLLWRTTRPGFAVAFVIASIGSPWLTLVGRNLYWVPWTWFLPACAALWWCIATTRRSRIAALVVLAAAFFIRWASGYEFLTSITLLAAAMPVLVHLFAGTLRTARRLVIRQVLTVVAVAFACFVVSAVILAFLVGAGDFAYGANVILFDAGKRTYGGVDVQDPALAASFAANPLDVVATYLFNWQTDVLTLGTGSPLQLSIGPNGLWLLVIAAVAVIAVRRFRKDPLWTRDVWILAIAMVVPLSWFVAAKAHAFIHPFIDFVLWYLVTIGALLWVVAAWVAPEARSLLRRVLRSGPARPGDPTAAAQAVVPR